MSRRVTASLPCLAPVLVVIALASGALAPLQARTTAAPTFTRITDPANPVVTEALESGGGAWMDLNGDGFLDLFVPHGNLSVQNSALDFHTGGMSFARVATGPVGGEGGSSIGGNWGDWDRDGHPDLFVTNRNNWGNFLYRGLGDSAFVKVTGVAAVDDRANSNSGAWVDVNGDGNLDLYVVNFMGDDFLYVNAGPPTYALNRTLVPSLTPGTEFSIHGVWADFDQDGDEDLFVGNAGTQNDYLFVNQGALSFTKRTITDGRSSLGGSWGDFDGDGDLDLFVANYQGQASILYRNDGPPAWTLTPVIASVYPGDASNSVGSAWGDVDNDGDLDLVVANDGAASALYLNQGPPTWALVRETTGAIGANLGNSFGCSFADVDRDGDLDLFVANRANEQDFLYRNDGPAGHWLAFHCTGTTSNPSALGARVRIRAVIDGAPRWQMQEVVPLTGYNSQNLELHFGLGDATVADSTIVEWPSGRRDTLATLPGDRRIALVEGQPVLGVGASGTDAAATLRARSANPFHDRLALEFSLARETAIALDVLDPAGRRIARLVSGRFGAGTHHATFDAPATLPVGIYWCRLSGTPRPVALRIARVR